METIYQSESHIIQYGMPRGIVFGPLLFIFYINDLPNATNNKISSFADDITIRIRYNDLNAINNKLRSVVNLLDGYNLRPNADKTMIMHLVRGF